MGTLGRVAAALVMLVVAATLPVMGEAAADQYESRKFYGVFEGDWLFLCGLIASGSCIWTAVYLLRRLHRR